MDSDCPLVSIGMAVRNCQTTLHLALKSLLFQTYSRWEVLLIDDGSSDETLQIAESFSDSRIRIVSDGERRGLPARLNQAIEMSRGKYFGRMDGDDVAYPERIERQVNYLERRPQVDLLGASAVIFKMNGIPMGKRACPQSHQDICAKPHAGFRIIHPTYMGRIEWFRGNQYNEKLARSQDQELLLRTYRFSRFANVGDILLGYRENRIDLMKLLTWRWFLVRAMAKEFRQERQPGTLIRALLEQAVKAMIDCVAVTSGLDYRLLSHRAEPITEAERSRWEDLWQLINANHS